MSLRIAAALCVLVAACSGGDDGAAGGGPLVPDAAGVVTEISFEQVRLDDGKSYPISGEVESFTARGHTVTPLVQWKDRYVHLGLDGQRRVEWISGIGIVTQADPPYVIYTGVFTRREGSLGYFEDGTVLRLADGVRTPDGPGREAVATIDPKRRLVTTLAAQ